MCNAAAAACAVLAGQFAHTIPQCWLLLFYLVLGLDTKNHVHALVWMFAHACCAAVLLCIHCGGWKGFQQLIPGCPEVHQGVCVGACCGYYGTWIRTTLEYQPL